MHFRLQNNNQNNCLTLKRRMLRTAEIKGKGSKVTARYLHLSFLTYSATCFRFIMTSTSSCSVLFMLVVVLSSSSFLDDCCFWATHFSSSCNPIASWFPAAECTFSFRSNAVRAMLPSC